MPLEVFFGHGQTTSTDIGPRWASNAVSYFLPIPLAWSHHEKRGLGTKGYLVWVIGLHFVLSPLSLCLPSDCVCVVLHSSTSVHLLSDWARGPLIAESGYASWEVLARNPFGPLLLVFLRVKLARSQGHVRIQHVLFSFLTRHQALPALWSKAAS